VSGRSEQHEKQADEYVNVFQTERIYDSALFKDMFVISDDVRLCHGEKQPKTGVAKYFDPRAKFATAWPLEGQIQCDSRDRQQPIMLHCCPQSETWCLKEIVQGVWWAVVWSALAYDIKSFLCLLPLHVALI